MEGVFVNLYAVRNEWPLDVIVKIVNGIKAYADSKGLSDVVLWSVEDSTYSDPNNQRYDIMIRYKVNGHEINQKMMMLKGEIIDGEEFHKRFREFYPER